MARKKKKFLTLLESYMKRFERGGFLVGDVFEFNKNFKSQPEYKQLAQNVRDEIDNMINTGLHIRVVGIKDTSPQRYPGSDMSSSLDVVLNLAVDIGGGRTMNHVSVPGCLGQSIQFAPNLLPIPDAMRRKDKVNIKPAEFDEDEENPSNKTDRGDGKLSQTERKLAIKNTNIPSKPATKSPEVNSYTKEYLKGLD